MIVAMILGCGIAFFIGKVLVNIQHHFIPSDAILSGGTAVGAALMFIPLIFPSLLLGMIAANFIIWCIPHARIILNQEASGVKNASFGQSMRFLFILLIIVIMISGPISLLGTFSYFYIIRDGIYLNPLFSIKQTHYRWSDIVKIESRCYAERDNLHLNYILIMKDGKKIDLFNESRLRFVTVYEEIRPFIKVQPNIEYVSRIGSNDIKMLWAYYPAHAEKIIKIIKDE